MNPIMRVVYGILGLGVLGVMLTLGAMFFVVFLAIALVGGSVLAARIWWLSRKAQKAFGGGFEQFIRDHPSETHPTASADRADVIEGEYTVVEERDKPRR